MNDFGKLIVVVHSRNKNIQDGRPTLGAWNHMLVCLDYPLEMRILADM